MRLRSSIIASILLLALSGCGAAASEPSRTAVTSPPAATTTAPATTSTTNPTATTSARKPPPKPRPNPGSLPQTHQLPSAATPAFHAEMAALWSGITSGSVRKAMPAFFPEAAYAQVKDIADPQGDYQDRLVSLLGLDLTAAHSLLGADPGSAQLVAVHVPEGYAHWVDPGACYNRFGYYEVPNARLLYRRGGEIQSLGIASMISWRGVWYVVHLGAVVRAAPVGMVDDPSSGAGESAPSTTC